MLTIYCTDPTLFTLAHNTAEQLRLEVLAQPTSSDYVLAFEDGVVALYNGHQKKQRPITVDLHTGAAEHRRKFGGGKSQMIAKAVGVSAQYKPKVLDATAGLGGDGFVLASLGCELTLQERSPIAYALLSNGLARANDFAQAASNDELMAVLDRMTLSQADSRSLDGVGHDVIYLDPMFPERKKSAAVNKGMVAFHALIGGDDDADELLQQALKQPVKRIVVKRPRHAPVLNDQAPTYTIEGKSSRFDIYALKKLGP